jgi:hypothetical protein
MDLTMQSLANTYLQYKEKYIFKKLKDNIYDARSLTISGHKIPWGMAHGKMHFQKVKRQHL